MRSHDAFALRLKQFIDLELATEDPIGRACSRTRLFHQCLLILLWVVWLLPASAQEEPEWFRAADHKQDPSASQTPLDVVNKDEAGGARVNWVGGYIEVVGYGTVDLSTTKSQTQASLMALRAARAEAQAKLLATIEGVRVTSGTVVKDQMAQSSGVATRVKGVLQGAYVISEDIDDKGDAPMGVVRMAVCLNARQGRCPTSSNLAETLKESIQEPGERRLYSPPEGAAVDEAKGDGPRPDRLIVDGRGLSAGPAMLARIVTEDGREVYGASHVEPSVIERTGMVTYARSLESALETPEAAPTPLVVKAQALSGRSDMVVTDADALRIYAADTAGGGFLHAGNVTFVLD